MHDIEGGVQRVSRGLREGQGLLHLRLLRAEEGEQPSGLPGWLLRRGNYWPHRGPSHCLISDVGHKVICDPMKGQLGDFHLVFRDQRQEQIEGSFEVTDLDREAC